jgi:hypothetical protein
LGSKAETVRLEIKFKGGNMQARYLYSELSTAIQARHNCDTSNPRNDEWFDKWTDRINELVDKLPSGSGIDCGTKIDLDATHAEKIVLGLSFHHMNDGGYYDGWTQHHIVVTPSFTGIKLRISGPNRNDIKDYLYETYDYALTREVEQIKA